MFYYVVKLMFVGIKTVVFSRHRKGLGVKCCSLQDTFLKLTHQLPWTVHILCVVWSLGFCELICLNIYLFLNINLSLCKQFH